jgi:hypothetical protein
MSKVSFEAAPIIRWDTAQSARGSAGSAMKRIGEELLLFIAEISIAFLLRPLAIQKPPLRAGLPFSECEAPASDDGAPSVIRDPAPC